MRIARRGAHFFNRISQVMYLGTVCCGCMIIIGLSYFYTSLFLIPSIRMMQTEIKLLHAQVSDIGNMKKRCQLLAGYTESAHVVHDKNHTGYNTQLLQKLTSLSLKHHVIIRSFSQDVPCCSSEHFQWSVQLQVGGDMYHILLFLSEMESTTLGILTWKQLALHNNNDSSVAYLTYTIKLLCKSPKKINPST